MAVATVAAPVVASELILDKEAASVELMKTKRPVAMFDIEMIPDEMTVDDVLKHWEQHKVLIYKPIKI